MYRELMERESRRAKQYTNRCSTSLVDSNMQIKPKIKTQFVYRKGWRILLP